MTSTASPPPKLIQALRYLLEPMVKLLLNYGMGYPAFSELMKRIYVDVADKFFALDGKPQTDSRVSLLSGVHRKDVKRLRTEAEAPLDLTRTSHVSLQAQLLAKWMGDAHYIDEDRRPLPLARLHSQDVSRSFEQMASELSKDVRPRVYLDEWLRLGLVRLDEGDIVHLNVDALLQSPGLEEKMDFFGRNIHDHLAAVVSNLEGQAAPFMDRCVFYHGLSIEQVAELKRRAEELSMDAMLEINRTAREMIEKNQGQATHSQRMHFGVYFYHAPEAESHESEQG